jgi:hypothetical protein
MPDVTPERFSVPVTVVGSKRSGRDALAQAVLDALNEADLATAARAITGTSWPMDMVGEMHACARRLVAAADALAALREAQQ